MRIRKAFSGQLSAFSFGILVLAFVPVCLLAQQRAPIAELGANLPAQTLGANDLIAVLVYDAPELSRTIRVASDGFIRLPMVKQTVLPMRAMGRK